MTSKVVILYVIDHFKDPNAGTEGQLYQLIKHLDRSLFSPELLVFTESSWLNQNDFPCKVNILGHRSLSSPAMWWALAKYAKSFRKHGCLAHVFFNDPSIICPPIFYLFGIKTLISRRDMGYWYTPTKKRLLKLIARFTCGVAVNSEAVANITIKEEGFKPAHVKVIYNGYETVNSSFQRVSELDALKAKGNVLIALVANIRPIKRISDVLHALLVLKGEGLEVDFVQIGDGDASELKRLANELGLSQQVYFLGKRNDVRDCLQYIDIGLLCSDSEGFSNAIVEYMREGLPVICSDVGGNGEAVEHDITGLLYPCGDIPKLAEAIKTLAVDKELRLKMGIEAKADALRKYSVENMVAEYAALYQQKLLT